MKQHKLTKGPLLDKKGRLIEQGYHTSLIKTYNKKLVRHKRFRLKEWDYYYLGNKNYGIALTIADNGYMWILSVTLLDFQKKSEISKMKIGFIPFKRFKMPKTSEVGNIVVNKGKWQMSFKHGRTQRHLEAYIPNFKGKTPLVVDLYLDELIEDSMVIATPFKKRTKFYYNQKINLLKSNGNITLGSEVFDFNECYGVLDWGRGSWTYHNTWYWASMSGIYKTNKIGLNLGYGFGDTSLATENMLFFNNQTYKLEDITFEIPLDGNGYDYMSPWKIVSKDEKVNLDFVPIYDRNSYSNVLIIKSDQHQVFGHFSGKIKVNDKTIEFEDMIGFAERVENKW